MRSYQRLAVSLATTAAVITACYRREVQPMGPTLRPLIPNGPAIAPLPDAGHPRPQVTQVVIQSSSGDMVAVDDQVAPDAPAAPDAPPPPEPKPEVASDAGVPDSPADLPPEVPDAGVVSDAGIPISAR